MLNKYKIVSLCIVIVGSILLLLVFKISFANSSREGESKLEEFNITKVEQSISKKIFNEGCIRNEKIAIEVTTPIFKSIYGDGFDNGMPLLVSFDEKKQVWLLKTQLPEGTEGGSKYIVIKKSNAEVIAIWATK